jgi:outer membrane protein assembly factor BamE (lipoprotein component of BamABCDE complex)
MKYFNFGIMSLLLITVVGCSSSRQTGIGNADPASYGLAKKSLVKGQTNQQQVLEIFGAPNITTKGTGEVAEVWTYEKVSSEYVASQAGVGGGYGVAGVPGGNVPMAGGLMGSYSKQKGASSVRTVTLIIKFDANEIVSDYKIMETNF